MASENVSQLLAMLTVMIAVSLIASIGANDISTNDLSGSATTAVSAKRTINVMDSCDYSVTPLRGFRCRLNQIRERPDKAQIILLADSFKNTGDWLTANNYVKTTARKGALTPGELAEDGVLEAFSQVLGSLDDLRAGDIQDLQSAIAKKYNLKKIDLRSAKMLTLSEGILSNRGKEISLDGLAGAELTALPDGGFSVVR